MNIIKIGVNIKEKDLSDLRSLRTVRKINGNRRKASSPKLANRGQQTNNSKSAHGCQQG
jgi:hypothetical protein